MNEASPRDAVQIEPLSVHIGALIHGVDLSQPLAPGERDTIREALLRWKVVFFHDQHLDHDGHVAMARQFGDPTPGHVVFGGQESHPEIYSVAKFRTANQGKGERSLRPWTGWHTDITAAINPPSASILRGDVVPPYGGDTQWVNLAAAYQALSPALAEFLHGLRGLHRFEAAGGQAATDYAERVRGRTMISEHPLVTVHPDSGERVLYVSPSFLKSIPGLRPRESEVLLELLWEQALRPEFMVRFRWRPGSVAFWDNRSTAHLAPSDIFNVDFDRQFYRVTLMGDVPRGVDGQPSTAIEGEPITPALTPAA
jgi:taurine dioxygenase